MTNNLSIIKTGAFKFISGLRQRRPGFTLVELVVVVGIIALLAAVAVPNVSKFVGVGNSQASASELDAVQAAMDVYMADNNLEVVPAQTTYTKDLSSSTPALYGGAFNYVRTNPAKCGYQWDAAGTVTQEAGCP